MTWVNETGADAEVRVRVYGYFGDANTYDIETQIVDCGAFCGDGILDPGEQCDDGNNIDDDGCSNACELDVVDDFFEDNDTAATAYDRRTSIPAEEFGVIVSGDDDWFAYEVCAGGTVFAEFGPVSPDLGFEMSLVDPTTLAVRDLDAGAPFGADVYGNVQWTNTLSAPADVLLRLEATEPGQYGDWRYGIRVEDCGVNICGDGDIDAGEECDDGNLIDGDDCSSTCEAELTITDAFDPNEDIAGAFALEDGEEPSNFTYTDLYVANGVDEDYFELLICPGGTVSATITFVDAWGDIDLRLLDAAGGELDASSGVSDSETVQFTNPTDTLYPTYLRVFMYSFNEAGRYDLTVDLTCP